LIGQINPPSSKGHKFVLLATDYFTKWVEAIPTNKVTSENMIEFVKEHIIYRFGIPQMITTGQGAQFVSLEFGEFAGSMGIKLFNSSPYYAQANGQAEASNKIMIKLIQKKIDQKPRRWNSVLNEALWAYRMAPHGATKTSPYELVYGHHAVLPWEMQSDSRRVVLQKDLSSKYYSGLMMDELEDLHMIRLRALKTLRRTSCELLMVPEMGRTFSGSQVCAW
jgi:transposase InsO family protein